MTFYNFSKSLFSASKRSTVLAVIMLAQCIILSSCDDVALVKQQTIDHLIIGTSADNPPFESFATQDGNQTIQGFDIDLAKAIGQKLDIKIEFVDMDFNGLIPALQAGRINMIMAGMTPTPERQQNFDFTDFYYSAPSALLVIQEYDHNPISPSELENKTIGVQLGSTHEITLKAMAAYVPNLKIVALNRLGDLVQELHSQRIDGLLTEKVIADAYKQTHLDFNVISLAGSESNFAIAFPRDSLLVDKFNAALIELRRNGELEAMQKKWFAQ